MGSEGRRRQLLTFSHFLPSPRLHRGPLLLGDIEGSVPLGEAVAQLQPGTHVFGHTHWQVETTIRGTRYVEHPLANPKERKEQPWRSLKISDAGRMMVDWHENPQLALVWQGRPP